MLGKEGLELKEEAFVVEGVCAENAVRRVCDRKTQCVFSVRGKIPNANKRSTSALLRNEQVSSLLGFLSSPGTGEPAFNRIIILCDPDIDGQHAGYLLGTMFRVVRPNWVEEGRVYVAKAPLIVESGETGTSVPFKNANSTSHRVLRYHKGIASMDPEVLARCSIHVKTRRLQIVTPC